MAALTMSTGTMRLPSQVRTHAEYLKESPASALRSIPVISSVTKPHKYRQFKRQYGEPRVMTFAQESIRGRAIGNVSSSRVAPRAVRMTCSAQKQEGPQFGSVLAAAALAAAVSLGSVEAAQADVSGLTKCSESKQYAKRQKQELKALDKRLKLYEAGSAPALALEATKQRTEKRFANYAGAGLLCGTDGLPHLIADPGLALRYGHAGEVFIPTFGFLYVAGWIGYVGRDYLIRVRGEAKPKDKEIIIDVPLAAKVALGGVGWPFKAIAELRNGTLLESDSKITVSPR